MARYKGDHVVRAANRALANEAAVALLTWRSGKARSMEAATGRTFIPGARWYANQAVLSARQAADAAALARQAADNMEAAFERNPCHGLANLAAGAERRADAAESYSSRAHLAARKICTSAI